MTGSLQVEETIAYCTVNHRASASNYQHEGPGPRFEPAASEVGGENSNRYSTEPPLISNDRLIGYLSVNKQYTRGHSGEQSFHH